VASTEELIASYVQSIHQLLAQLDVPAVGRVVDALRNAREKGKFIFIVGNGGSASTSSHFACDLSKAATSECGNRLKALALTDNIALLTAWGNDSCYDDVFAEQLVNVLEPGDVLIAISASGRSPNILKAVRLATSLGATTIGLSGFDGGELALLVDLGVVIPSNDYGHVEDLHLMLEHMITICLKEATDAQSNFRGQGRRDQREPGRSREDVVGVPVPAREPASITNTGYN
jgi:D-sedoheptulose 7-phosphate isomerase